MKTTPPGKNASRRSAEDWDGDHFCQRGRAMIGAQKLGEVTRVAMTGDVDLDTRGVITVGLLSLVLGLPRIHGQV